MPLVACGGLASIGRSDPCRIAYRCAGAKPASESNPPFSSSCFKHTRQSGDLSLQSPGPGSFNRVETGALRRFPPGREATRLSPFSYPAGLIVSYKEVNPGVLNSRISENILRSRDQTPEANMREIIIASICLGGLLVIALGSVGAILLAKSGRGLSSLFTRRAQHTWLSIQDTITQYGDDFQFPPD
jgi:hypothetical protein